MRIAKPFFNFSILTILLLIALSFSCNTERKLIESGKVKATNQYTQLSVKLMQTVRTGESTKGLQEQLAKLNPDSLASGLVTDAQKKTFWINIYNAHIQIILSKNSELFEDRGKFFSSKMMVVAKENLSFDDIEHGIIRGSKFKLALGLIKNPFAGKFEKLMRTNKEDGRVHFALNCGAKSCPLVATYMADNFDTKIDEVAKNFLQKMSTYSAEEGKVLTTPLFSWFRGDFDGKKGILKFLKKYEVIPQDKKPKIEYDSYDWTLSLGNYYEK